MTTLLDDQLILEEVKVPTHERVIKIHDPVSGLKAIIAIHNRSLCKAALGGTRIYPYASFDDALTDVLRLSEGMTYKSAACEAGWGGGKSVIMADPKKLTKEMLHAFGEAVNRLEGEYICAEDVGCGTEEVKTISEKTPYVVGLVMDKSSGNPSYFTAWGVFRGIEAVMQVLFKTDAVAGRTVAIQGLGNVGEVLGDLLFWRGAKLIVTDIDMQKAERLGARWGAKVVEPGEIFEQPCDVFAPCAMGGIINEKVLDRLRCRAIAGATNNQLLKSEDGDALKRAGILYAPDFVINAGGLINVSNELEPEGYHPLTARNQVDKIYDQLLLIFDIAEKNHISTQRAAVKLAEYRLQYGVGKRDKKIYMHHAGVSY